MNARSKGLGLVRQVKIRLRNLGYLVEGPGYSTKFFNGRMNAVHSDFFGVYDLMAYRLGFITGHQVSTLSNKASKCKNLKDNGLAGYVWCHVERGDWRIWFVDTDGQEEEIFEENL